MTRFYERLAGLNALVGVLALVVGLAAVPQNASGAIAVPVPTKPCEGGCSVWWNVLSYKCELLLPCLGSCGCKTSNLIDEQTGLIINCRAEGCWTF